MTAPTSLPLPPGRMGLPLLGETLSFLKDPDFAQKRHQQYGPLFKTRLFGQPTIYLSGAAANRFLLSHDNHYFIASWPRSTRTLLGPASLAVQAGEAHRKRRKLLAQAFQPRALASYLPTMAAITHRYLERWQELANLTWYPELRNYTLDIACQLLVGVASGSQTPLGQWFETWCNGLFTVPLPWPWTRFGRALRCRQRLLREIEGIVRQRQQEPVAAQDALGLLLQAEDEEGNRLEIDELKDQILLLLFAGHETLTSAIASLCLLLAQHPEVQAKARAEQEQLALSGPLTLEQLKQMSYLEQVLKEVLRLIPPVGGGFRSVIRACEFEGYALPKGWSVLYQISQTHQDRQVYPQPHRFDPDRFQVEGAADRQQPFSYVPFGGGIRECLGREFAKLEMKIFASLLLRHCDWELLPGQNLNLVTVPTPHPQDGLRVRLRRR